MEVGLICVNTVIFVYQPEKLSPHSWRETGARNETAAELVKHEAQHNPRYYKNRETIYFENKSIVEFCCVSRQVRPIL